MELTCSPSTLRSSTRITRHPQRRQTVAVDAVVAETVIVSGHERLGPHLSYQIAPGEFLAGEGAERAVERDHDHVVHPQPAEQRHLFVERRKQPQSLAASQRDAGMRVEGQHDAFASDSAGFGREAVDQRAVSEVHAVVRPHGDDRADEPRQRVETTEDADAVPSRISALRAGRSLRRNPSVLRFLHQPLLFSSLSLTK